ncbi:MAG: hypothetical protein HQK65_13715 [Desulfamplus sp.]|nr:hypothetical protein [Desulfamplus sp.]
MNYSKKKRRSIRLKGYDYSRAGAYFVTICVQDRECLFGKIVDGKMILNDTGKMVETCWLEIPEHFLHVKLDVFCIMPNHIHGVLIIIETVGAKNILPLQHGTSKTIGSIVRGFKIGVTKWVRQQAPNQKVWQRNYYEHIIRDENDYNRIYDYIQNNPLKWELDSLYPNK